MYYILCCGAATCWYAVADGGWRWMALDSVFGKYVRRMRRCLLKIELFIMFCLLAFRNV